jgi:hypothetical protein
VDFVSEINGFCEGLMLIKGTEDSRIKTHEEILLLILFFLPPCDVFVVVLELPQACQPYSLTCMRRRVSGISEPLPS